MFLIHHVKMKIWVLFCVIACIAEVSSIFLSLLYHLKMNNPVIVGKINDLKNKDMIQLFKDVNGLDQSICMIAVLKNNSLQIFSGNHCTPRQSDTRQVLCSKGKEIHDSFDSYNLSPGLVIT